MYAWTATWTKASASPQGSEGSCLYHLQHQSQGRLVSVTGCSSGVSPDVMGWWTEDMPILRLSGPQGRSPNESVDGGAKAFCLLLMSQASILPHWGSNQEDDTNMERFGFTRDPKFLRISSHQWNPCTKYSLADCGGVTGGRRFRFIRVYRTVIVLQTLGMSAY